jgi:hypothetical protein
VKGALVEFSTAFGASVPNVIAFQFNPETLKRTWTQPEPKSAGSNPLGVAGMPGEAYSLTLMLDITDELAGLPGSPGTADATATGLGSRIAALEMLMFPVPAEQMPGRGTDRRTTSATPAAQVPAVLFIWGLGPQGPPQPTPGNPAPPPPSAGRILPVRITTLSITETLFDPRLNPTHATVDLSFRVLTPTELAVVAGPLKDFAAGAYQYSQRQRERLALVNLTASASAFPLPPLPKA